MANVNVIYGDDDLADDKEWWLLFLIDVDDNHNHRCAKIIKAMVSPMHHSDARLQGEIVGRPKKRFPDGQPTYSDGHPTDDLEEEDAVEWISFAAKN